VFRRYACVRQRDMVDCGPAALATVALHYRRPISLEQMRDLTGTDRIGSNLLGLLKAAEKLGFSARGVKGTYEALVHVPLPAIAHIKNKEGLGHFVVLHRLKRSGVIAADPGEGIRKLSREQFSKCWTGYLLLLVPELQAAPAVVGQAPVSPWRRFLRLLAPHTGVLMEGFLCTLLMTFLGLSTSYFIQHLTDTVLPHAETRLLNGLGIGMILILLFRCLFGMLRQYLAAHVSRKVDLTLIAGYSRHLLNLPMRFFETRRVGEILSRVNDAAKVRDAISGTTLTAVVDGTLVVVLLIVIFLYDLPLALVATAFVPLLLATTMVHHPAAKRLSRQAMENSALHNAHLVEDVTGVETVKAFGAERARSEVGEARLVELELGYFSLQKLGISMSAMGTLTTTLAGIAILWYGGHRVIQGALTIGELMFFYTLLGYMLGPLERLASADLKLQDALVAVDRLYQILDIEMEAGHRGKKTPFPGGRLGLELRDVSFAYGSRANVLQNINLRIPACQTVAILGESGSGKSTLLKLLMGYYEPTAGRILIGRTDMRDFDLESLRSRIGLVSQDAFIFNGTIRDNITLGNPVATAAEVTEAARIAELEDFILGLPDRYDTVIGERGANLSGGQRQRLAIARALVRKPEILIFDEATSHLDTATERAMQKSLRRALAGRTVVLVAHRLSTVKDANLIYVLHRGKIVEQGNHRQLLAAEGRYWDLWRAQSGETDSKPDLREQFNRLHNGAGKN
jgi:ATP-binding cassette, subfamily C, bacteriocin exporter